MPSKRNQSKNQNDLKTFKSLYKQHLSSLIELFPGWSQEDLLFVMDECQGDLDLAINRISEGHASQWGQVKTKRTKSVQQKKPFLNNKGDSRGSKSKGKPSKSKHNNNKQEVKPQANPEPQKPSWASILKGPPSPPPTEQKTVEPVKKEEAKDEQTRVTEETKQESTEKEQEPEKEIDEQADTLNEIEKKEAVNEEEQQQQQEEEIKEIEEPTEVKEEQEDRKEQESREEKTRVMKEEKVIQVHRTIRRLNQTEAVVLPTNQSAPIASVNVQFGSLTISTGNESIEVGEKEDEKTREVESKNEVVTQTVTEQVPQQKEEPPQPEISLPQQQQLQTPQPQPQPQPHQQLPSFQSVAQPSSVQAAQHVAQQANTQPPLPVNQLHPLQQQQQQQQQTPLPMAGLVGFNYPLQQTQQQPVADSYINPYYVPHTAAGYTGGEYNTVYSNDTQRMGYYDPYGHSPSVGSAHLFRDKYSTVPPHPHHPPAHHPPVPQQQTMMVDNSTPPPPPPTQYGGHPYYSYYYYPNYQPQNNNYYKYPVYGGKTFEYPTYEEYHGMAHYDHKYTNGNHNSNPQPAAPAPLHHPVPVVSHNEMMYNKDQLNNNSNSNNNTNTPNNVQQPQQQPSLQPPQQQQQHQQQQQQVPQQQPSQPITNGVYYPYSHQQTNYPPYIRQQQQPYWHQA